MIESSDIGIESNIDIKSNIYIRSSENILNDNEYLKQIMGIERLKNLKKSITTDIELSEFQNNLLKEKVKCALDEKSEISYGIVKEGDKFVWSCRCENINCEQYNICLNEKYYKKIKRLQKRKTNEEEKTENES